MGKTEKQLLIKESIIFKNFIKAICIKLKLPVSNTVLVNRHQFIRSRWMKIVVIKGVHELKSTTSVMRVRIGYAAGEAAPSFLSETWPTKVTLQMHETPLVQFNADCRGRCRLLEHQHHRLRVTTSCHALVHWSRVQHRRLYKTTSATDRPHKEPGSQIERQAATRMNKQSYKHERSHINIVKTNEHIGYTYTYM